MFNFFKKVGRLLVFGFPFLLISGIVSILLGESHTAFVFSILLPIIVVLNLVQCIYLIIRRNKFAVFNCIGILLFLICFDSFFQFNLNNSASQNELTLLSFNVQGFKSGYYVTGSKVLEIVDFIKQTNADIVCFQEFSAIQYKHFNKDYPHWVKTNLMIPHRSVLAIFSKYPIVNKGYIEFPKSRNTTLFVDLNINNELVRLYNVHLESYKAKAVHELNNPENYKPLAGRIFEAEKMRAEQAQLVKNHSKGFKGAVIFAGDFNSTQYSPVYRILKQNMKDTFTEAGTGIGCTFELLNYPFKIDHILVDDTMEVINHTNFNLNLSDHEPILAEIKL